MTDTKAYEAIILSVTKLAVVYIWLQRTDRERQFFNYNFHDKIARLVRSRHGAMYNSRGVVWPTIRDRLRSTGQTCLLFIHACEERDVGCFI